MTETHHRADLSIDQTLALKRAATRLSGEFDGTFGKETIDRFLHSSYGEFAGRATIPNFLPLLAERFARQRLKALAKIEQPDTNAAPVVLFLCTHNAGRSQMAMGFLQHLAGDGAVAWSGGSQPSSTINPAAVEAMAERGIDISTSTPSRGPTRWSAPPTWSSRWAAVTRARSSRVDGTRSGSCPTRMASASARSARSVTRSRTACGSCFVSSRFRPSCKPDPHAPTGSSRVRSSGRSTS